jgi:8-oxo-dGTP pyrophosphatase MutT (NUDIX family)
VTTPPGAALGAEANATSAATRAATLSDMWPRALPNPGTPDDGVVRAAGGMIVRRSPAGRVEVAVVHRPFRVDWSFPKGKCEPNESLEACAIREVFEETGFHCRLGPFVGHTEYIDRKERPKVVVYWVMHRESGTFAPGDEVDEVRWVGLAEAGDLLTYERDRELLELLAAAARTALNPEMTVRTA